MVSNIFKELVNNRFVDHLEKCGIFFYFQYGFRSSRCSGLLHVLGLVACTCNPASLGAKFQNGVGLRPVGGNSFLIGGWIV